MNRKAIEQSLVPALFALWLWTLTIARVLTIDAVEGGDKKTMFAALSWPFLLYLVLPQFRKSFSASMLIRNSAFFAFLCALVATNAVSIMLSDDPVRAGGYFASIVMGLFLTYSFILAMSKAQLIQGIFLFGMLGAIVLGILASMGEVGDQERLRAILNPNHVGVMAFSVIMASLLSPRILFLTLAAGPSLIILFMTNSRSAMLALILGLALWFAFRANWVPSLGTITYAFSILSIVSIALLLSQADLKSLLMVVADTFAVYDPQRGLGTGGTGRWDLWKETWRLFLDHPVLGVGHKMHEGYLKGGSSAHNGYLAQLAEGGVICAVPIAYFMMRGIRRTATSVAQPLEAWSAAFIVGFLFIACFESLLLGIALPTTHLVMALLIRGFLISPERGPERRGLSPSDRFWERLRPKVATPSVMDQPAAPRPPAGPEPRASER